jgi:hypothetical protein
VSFQVQALLSVPLNKENAAVDRAAGKTDQPLALKPPQAGSTLRRKLSVQTLSRQGHRPIRTRTNAGKLMAMVT